MKRRGVRVTRRLLRGSTRSVAGQNALCFAIGQEGLPVQQPTRFHCALNARTARALNIEVPRALLLVVDEVIE